MKYMNEVEAYQVYEHGAVAATRFVGVVRADALWEWHKSEKGNPDVAWAVEYFIRRGEIKATTIPETIVVVEWLGDSVGDVWLYEVKQGPPVAAICGLNKAEPVEVVMMEAADGP